MSCELKAYNGHEYEPVMLNSFQDTIGTMGQVIDALEFHKRYTPSCMYMLIVHMNTKEYKFILKG